MQTKNRHRHSPPLLNESTFPLLPLNVFIILVYDLWCNARNEKTTQQQFGGEKSDNNKTKKRPEYFDGETNAAAIAAEIFGVS